MHIHTTPLKNYSSLRVGGEGKVVTVTTTEELKEADVQAKASGLRLHVLGEGTNSYFGEDLSQFLFIKMNLRGIEVSEGEEDVRLTIAAGEVWDDVVELSVEKEWWGIENLSHIPGTAGAAPVQNIGAYGAEFSNVFESLTALDMETKEEKIFLRDDCRFGYRDSIFKHENGKYIILSMQIKLSKRKIPLLTYTPLDSLSAEDVTISEVRDLVIATRNTKLPDWHEYPNAGSFFKNPVINDIQGRMLYEKYPTIPLIHVPEGYKIPAAWLVEHVAEMKGVREGNLGTWPTQPLVIVNYGKATADDIDIFAGKISRLIHEKIGIVLEQEVNRIG